ncbi:Transposase [Mycoavidus cysteinexigens]|uniref:Transposase n=1 Tax=Mycoavidus cysteinexigens TaxID=1553431 RepID=A0A2Z6EWC8_9BURK|nr:Transposase [Mycoavidus cysteinexigens]GLR02229.1 hypothetical protein GCM10007934_20440 [Mycoavidus cysteinexigens]
MYGLSDEEVVWGWVENPYQQYFTEETYLQTKAPIDPSSLTRWRKRLSEAGVEELLAEMIESAKRCGLIQAASVKCALENTNICVSIVAEPVIGSRGWHVSTHECLHTGRYYGNRLQWEEPDERRRSRPDL